MRVQRPVLVVEDNEINQMVVVDLLERVGLSVDTASDGSEAVERIRKSPYALVMMDVQMPVMDGLQATSLIRRLPNGWAVPILALTANAFREDREACLAAGMNDFVAKPFAPEALYAMVLHWLQPHRIARPPRDNASDALRSRLAGWQELDLSLGLQGCDGNIDALHDGLRDFFQSHEHSTAGIGRMLAAGQSGAATELARHLGVKAETLGLRAIRDAAGTLVTELEVCGSEIVGSSIRQLDEAVLRLGEYLQPGSGGGLGVPRDEPVIDRGALARLYGADVQRQHEILTTFMEDARKHMAAVSAAREAGDTERLRFLAHRFKSAARAVGANAFAASCESLERAARYGDATLIAELTGNASQELERLVDTLNDTAVTVPGTGS